MILFNSGVGHFTRSGEVDGDARVDLTFPEQDINDLIKSMTLRDLSPNGRVAAVTYDSHDPIDRTLASFAINLNNSPTFAQILTQARGEQVEVTLINTASQPGNLTGKIIGVEQQQVPSKDGHADHRRCLNLWCAEGVRAVKLSEVQRLRFANPVIENEMRRALETLALSHDAQKKAVSLHFAGEGKRKVEVGYVIENPIWKTSYRLVLDKEGAKKPYLQGWAVVENPTDEDWQHVTMALVSGRPISFKMDLYNPLYVNRPTVEPELFATLRPPTYRGAMAARSVDERICATAGRAALGRCEPTQVADAARKTAAFGLQRPLDGVSRWRASQGDEQRRTPATSPRSCRTELEPRRTACRASRRRRRSATTSSTSSTTRSTWPARSRRCCRSSTRTSRASASASTTRPCSRSTRCFGLKFKNTTGMPLTQGPITVFEGSVYAGDTRVLDLQPDEERLVSYAIDLGTEVAVKPGNSASRITSVKAVKGIIYTQHDSARRARLRRVEPQHDRSHALDRAPESQGPGLRVRRRQQAEGRSGRRVPLRAARRREEGPELHGDRGAAESTRRCSSRTTPTTRFATSST